MLWKYLCYMGARKEEKIKNIFNIMCTAVPMSRSLNYDYTYRGVYNKPVQLMESLAWREEGSGKSKTAPTL